MVMEQKPAVVVMLTKVEENGKVSSLCTLHTRINIMHIVTLKSMQSVLTVDVYVPFLFILYNDSTIIVFKMNLKVYAHTVHFHVPIHSMYAI